MAKRDRDPMVVSTRASAAKLEAIGWGIFFLWIGIALAADVGWAVGLLGVGLIALGTQLARQYVGLPIERFGLVAGVVLAAWGILKLLNVGLDEPPIPGGWLPLLFIAVGGLLVVSALRHKPSR